MSECLEKKLRQKKKLHPLPVCTLMILQAGGALKMCEIVGKKKKCGRGAAGGRRLPMEEGARAQLSGGPRAALLQCPIRHRGVRVF